MAPKKKQAEGTEGPASEGKIVVGQWCPESTAVRPFERSAAYR